MGPEVLALVVIFGGMLALVTVGSYIQGYYDGRHNDRYLAACPIPRAYALAYVHGVKTYRRKQGKPPRLTLEQKTMAKLNGADKENDY